MVSAKVDKIYQKIFEPTDQQIILEVSKAFMPFSNIDESKKTEYIYLGNEEIPFKERDSEYKMILRQEFANTFNFEFKVFRSVIKFPFF